MSVLFIQELVIFYLDSRSLALWRPLTHGMRNALPLYTHVPFARADDSWSCFSPVLGRLGLHWSWGTRVGTGEGHCPSQSGIPSENEMSTPGVEPGCRGHDTTS